MCNAVCNVNKFKLRRHTFAQPLYFIRGHQRVRGFWRKFNFPPIFSNGAGDKGSELERSMREKYNISLVVQPPRHPENNNSVQQQSLITLTTKVRHRVAPSLFSTVLYLCFMFMLNKVKVSWINSTHIHIRSYQEAGENGSSPLDMRTR